MQPPSSIGGVVVISDNITGVAIVSKHTSSSIPALVDDLIPVLLTTGISAYACRSFFKHMFHGLDSLIKFSPIRVEDVTFDVTGSSLGKKSQFGRLLLVSACSQHHKVNCFTYHV